MKKCLYKVFQLRSVFKKLFVYNYDVNNFEISHINTDFHFIYFNPKVLWLGKCTEGTN